MSYPLEWLDIAEKKGLTSKEYAVLRSRYVTIPLPPSLNNCFVNSRNGGRYKSKRYKTWQKVAIPMLANTRAPMPCSVLITVQCKLRATQDIDNLIKPILDAAKEAGVFADDNCEHVRGVEIRYEPQPNAIGVMVEFKELTR